MEGDNDDQDVALPNFVADLQPEEGDQELRRIIDALDNVRRQVEPSARDVEEILRGAPAIPIPVLQGFFVERVTGQRRSMRCTTDRENILRVILERYPAIARSRIGRETWYLLHLVCSDDFSRDSVHAVIEAYPEALGFVDYLGYSPLHYACCGDSYTTSPIDVIQLLVSAYRDPVTWLTRNNKLPLHKAFEAGAPDDVVFFLLDTFPESARVETTLGEAIGCFQYFDLSATVVIRLVQMYPEALGIETDGTLPLHKLVQPSDVHVRDPGYRRTLGLVRFFVDQSPERVASKCNNGMLPLHYAAMSLEGDVLRYLIGQYAASLCVKDGTGSLPIHRASSGENAIHNIRLLLESYQGPAASHGGLSVVNQDGRIPLHLYSGNATAESEMLQHLIDVYPEGIHLADANGKLPLHSACNRDRPILAAIRTLVDADPLTVLWKDQDGSTPYQLAWREDYEQDQLRAEVAEYLVGKQDEIALELKQAWTQVADTELGLPDLIVARVWAFCKPDLWHPETPSNGDDDANEVNGGD